MDLDTLTYKIIGAGMVVHQTLGPGLLESTYEECSVYEMSSQGLYLERQKGLPIVYKAIRLDCGYRMDLVVERKVIVEFKCATRIEPIHEAQMLTYLKLSGMQIGLILNFRVPVLKDGIKRIVNNFDDSQRTRRLRGDN